MDLALDILQGAGLAAACGIRPTAPVLAAGALSREDLGVDFGGTDFSFLESTGFLGAAAAVLALLLIAQRRGGVAAVEAGTLGAAVAGIGVGLGALLFAGTLADHGHPVWIGIVGGIACALLAQATVRTLFGRVGRRLDEAAGQTLPIIGEVTAVVLAVLAVAFPPLSVVALAFLAWLLLGMRRREGEKYAGLRVLR